MQGIIGTNADIEELAETIILEELKRRKKEEKANFRKNIERELNLYKSLKSR